MVWKQKWGNQEKERDQEKGLWEQWRRIREVQWSVCMRMWQWNPFYMLTKNVNVMKINKTLYLVQQSQNALILTCTSYRIIEENHCLLLSVPSIHNVSRLWQQYISAGHSFSNNPWTIAASRHTAQLYSLASAKHNLCSWLCRCRTDPVVGYNPLCTWETPGNGWFTLLTLFARGQGDAPHHPGFLPVPINREPLAVQGNCRRTCVEQTYVTLAVKPSLDSN